MKTPEWYAAKRKEYVTALVKAGPKKASIQAREECANAIISRLASTYPRGVRAQNALHIQGRFRAVVSRAQEAIGALRQAIERDPVGAQAFGLQPHSLRLCTAQFERYLASALSGIESQAKRTPKPRRGPKNGAAIEIVKMMAAEYTKRFEEVPATSKAMSKRGEVDAGADAPFVRMCGVVQKILCEMGHGEISLSDGARLTGIQAATQVQPIED